MSESKRYSDAELAVFKDVVEKKLGKTRTELEQLLAQLDELKDHMDERSDWLDDSYNQSESEMLVNMINRQKKHANDLESALIRIKNKTYGICEITGELIDKRRLLAVPTTSKSLAAKNAIKDQENKGTVPFRATTVKPKPNPKQIITKKISKNTNSSSKGSINNLIDDDDDDIFENDDTLYESLENIEEIDIDEDIDD